jgi:GEVED domain
MLKRILSAAFILLQVCLFSSMNSSAQCGAGYTQAQVNWDKLDYYFNNGVNVRPYGNVGVTYVTDAMEQTQKFAIGPNYVTIATSSNAVVNPGNFNGVTAENILHTGDLAGYTGADVEYDPSANGQTITLTFNTAVTNLNLALYDLDGTSRYDFAAVNGAVPQLITLGLQGVTNLTAFLNGTVAPFVTSTAANAVNTVNTNTATVTVAGPVTQLTITVTTIGTDPVFWMSDINACVTGTFPSNDNQTGSNQPFTGPVINQGDYFIITPDNDSAFMVDPVSGKAWFLFADPANTYMNSFAYNPVSKYLYYISEGLALNANNKSLKKFDFNTETISTVIADITTLNIPTFNSGVESAAAGFYNGQLFLGFEGGKFDNSNTRESIVFRLDLNASGVPINACQVFSTNSYNGANAIHDWADLVLENGVLYNYNSRPGVTMVSYEHFNMMTGQSTQYLNPNAGVGNAFQSGLTWTGDQYSFSSGAVTKYLENGTLGTPVTITSAEGLTWKTGAGDASENFRPKSDFGDAPATYDPVATSPAVHERTDSIRLGATWDKEFLKRGVTGNNDVDDGIASTPIMAPGPTSAYVVQVSAYNHSGLNARMIAWLDYNGNGVFDASEAIAPITVPSSTSAQNFWLFWSSTPNTFANGTYTYLRVRITADSSGMTSSHATGYFRQGEVEDYKILVDNFPLATQLLSFNAVVQDKKVKLTWTASEDAGTFRYDVERSTDNIEWRPVSLVAAHGTSGTFDYQAEDAHPQPGTSYYRVKIAEASGSNRYSGVRRVTIDEFETKLSLIPNPAKTKTNLRLDTQTGGDATVYILSMEGKMTFSHTYRVTPGSNDIELVIPNSMSPGNYIVRVVAGKEIIERKLVVNK